MISREGLSEQEWRKLLYSTPVEEHNQWDMDLYEDYLKYPDYNSGLHLMNVEDVEKVVWWAVAGFRWKLEDWRAYIAEMDDDEREDFEEHADEIIQERKQLVELFTEAGLAFTKAVSTYRQMLFARQQAQYEAFKNMCPRRRP